MLIACFLLKEGETGGNALNQNNLSTLVFYTADTDWNKTRGMGAGLTEVLPYRSILLMVFSFSSRLRARMLNIDLRS